MIDQKHKLKHPEAATTFPDYLTAMAANMDRMTGAFDKKKAAKDFEKALHTHPDPKVRRDGEPFTPEILAATEDQMESSVEVFAALANQAATSQVLEALVSARKK